MLEKGVHPWAWSRGNIPQRCIAALELLAVVYLVAMAAAELRPRGGARLSPNLRAITGNQGNAFSILRGYSKEMPSAAVHLLLLRRLRMAGRLPSEADTPPP